MSNSAIRSGRPKKGKSPFKDIFRELISNLTQQEAAEKIGVARQNIGRWTSETTPDIETLCKIADAFNVSTDYLLGRTPNKTTDQKLKGVCEYTGLSENAVTFLHNLQLGSERFTNDNSDNTVQCADILKAFSILLDSGSKSKELGVLLRLYLFTDFSNHNSGYMHNLIKEANGSKEYVASLPCEVLENASLLEIQRIMQSMKLEQSKYLLVTQLPDPDYLGKEEYNNG